MAAVIHMDTLDFVSKMEGFAVQGVRGKCLKNLEHMHNLHFTQVLRVTTESEFRMCEGLFAN